MSKKEVKRPLAMNKDICNLAQPAKNPAESKHESIRDVKSKIETAVAAVHDAITGKKSENHKPANHKPRAKSREGSVHQTIEQPKKLMEGK